MAASVSSTALALHGGPPAVTVPHRDRWERIGPAEIESVVALLQRGAGSPTSMYDEIDLFEAEFRRFTGARFALAQCNGTSTIHSAVFAAGVRPGDEVIVPSYTWHASITPILHCGGTIVFCEIDPRTHTADPADVARRITPRTKAIVVTHVYGNVAKMDELIALSRQHGIGLIEDCSHAHGATYDGQAVGTIGDIGCFSLQASKAVMGVEAGVVTTNNPELYDRMVVLGHYGRIQRQLVGDTYRDLHDIGLGVKYRANPMAMAMARVQLRRLPQLNERRRATFAFLDRALGEIPGIRPVETYPQAIRGGLLQYTATYDESVVGAPLGVFLKAVIAEGVTTQPTITPLGYGRMHLEPLFNDFPLESLGGPWGMPGFITRHRYAPGSLPVSEAVAGRVFWLPAFADPEPGLLEQYVDAIRKVVANAHQLAGEPAVATAGQAGG
ncbi:MAG TPA: DegT/DnrJ/EryC1/StrS family aminotransferase [Chloroflexota bacterium]|jgi:dTDP-4-amino-4,6-dideoxygalactose transaminase|nr:DegT/DnrJ/EryC1/StrS family aminotransferase [Chloroflexota bacterium]